MADVDPAAQDDAMAQGDSMAQGHATADADLRADQVSASDDHAWTEDDSELPTPSRRSPLTFRGVAMVGARVVAGTVGIAVAVVTVAAAALLPLPTITPVAPSLVVEPVPTAEQLVCPGAILRLADDIGQGATTASAIGVPTIRYGSSTGSVDSARLEQSDASTGGTAAAPLIISTAPKAADAEERILLSGAQVQESNEGDFVGLTAAACVGVSGDTWLAGGSTAVGRTTLLLLSNPTAVPATVNLELFGEGGAITAPGTSGIVVAARGQRVLSLAGFAPDVESPVVRVRSVGGQVTAQLQQSTVRGLQAGGIDVVSSTLAPSTENVIAGVLVTDSVAVQELQGGGPGFDDLRTVLRLFAPGTGQVSATISVIPEDGVGAGTSFALDFDAGRVTDVPIDELEDGSYTVRIDSDQPMIASARVSSALDEVADFAWASSASPLSATTQLTVAAGPAPLMHLANGLDTEAVVILSSSVGPDSQVQIAAGATATISLEPGATYVVRDADRLFISITFAGDGLVAHYTAQPSGGGSSAVVVYR